MAELKGDDDFDDFGGFEAADPIFTGEAQSIPEGLVASPSPWAVFPEAPSGGKMRPDLLQSPTVNQQARPDLSASQSELDTIQSSQNESVHFNADFNADFSMAFPNSATSPAQESFPKRSVTEQVLEPDFGGPMGGRRVACGGPPDGVLDLDLGQASNDNELSSLQAASADSEPIRPPVLECQQEERQSDSPAVQPEVPPSAPPVVSQETEALQQKLTEAEQQKLQFQQELRELLQRDESLQVEVSQLKEQLKEQKQKYDDMQHQQEEQLEAVRKAGHEALAIMVEEYKGLCKIAVVEQREIAESHLLQVLEQETIKHEELLKFQDEKMKEKMVQESQKLEGRITEALDNQKKRHDEHMEVFLCEERKKSEDTLKKAVEEEHKKSQEAIEKALKSEQEKFQQMIEEQKLVLQQRIHEEQEKGQKVLADALEEESLKCKTFFQEASEEERVKNENLAKEIREKAKEEMASYVIEQKQMDQATRRRNLAAMDVFLEGTRKQLDLLLHDGNNSPGQS